MNELNKRVAANGNWSEQRRNKPNIENLVSEIITGGEMKKTALDFIAYLRKNNFGIVWSCANEWWVTLYCRAKCKISLRDDSWANDERLNECSWAVGLCLSHTSEFDESVISKSSQDPILYYDPDENAVKNIINRLESHKKAINLEGKKNPSLYQRQKAIKPLIEDVIPQYLDVGTGKNALDLAAWLRENKISPKWTLTNTWNSNYKGKALYRIVLGEEVWCNSRYWFVELRLYHLNGYADSIMDEGLQKIIWDGVKYCGGCTGCAPGRNATLFGKECEGLCHAPNVAICDPDEEAVNGIKRLLLMEKRAREGESAAKKNLILNPGGDLAKPDITGGI